MLALGFASSGRKDGNSTTLLKTFLEGAAEAGADPKLYFLGDLNYRGCLGCLACMTTGECVQQDDLTPLYPLLREARLWALASPIYFDGVSGILKSFYDRLYPFTHESGKLEGQRAGVLLATYEERLREDYTTAVRPLTSYLRWMGGFTTDMMVEGGLGPAGAAASRPDLLTRARDMGRFMTENLKEQLKNEK
jgi:multimeric flavodoxin WrbA